MFYYFLAELLSYYDITKFHGHWFANEEITQGGGIHPLPGCTKFLKARPV